MPKPTRVVHLEVPFSREGNISRLSRKGFSKEKHSGLFVRRISHEENNFITLTTVGQCYITFLFVTDAPHEVASVCAPLTLFSQV